MELEGKKLLAELAKEPTRESNPGRKNEGAKAETKNNGGSNTDKANDKRGRKDKRKNSKDKTAMNDDDDEDSDEDFFRRRMRFEYSQ